MQELHLHDEGGAGAVPAPHVQDGELRAFHQGELLARQLREALDLLVARALEKVVEEVAEELWVRREDAAEDEVVLEVREHHG